MTTINNSSGMGQLDLRKMLGNKLKGKFNEELKKKYEKLEDLSKDYILGNASDNSGNHKARPLCSKAKDVPRDEKTEQTYTIVTSRSEMKEFVAEPLPFNAVTKVTIEVNTSTILVYFNDALKLNFQYKNVNCYALLKDYVANLNAYADNSIIKSLITL